jgi:glutamate-1-semialdehyde 2,1-aminomutase
MRTVAIVQARLGSKRLPKKVLRKVGGVPMIEALLTRLSRAKRLDQVVVATSVAPENRPLVNHVESIGYQCFCGSEDDVLDRYFEAAKYFNAEIIVRITGDCPLVDPVLVDEAVRLFNEGKFDYLSNTMPPTFPDGLDIEVFSNAVIASAAANAVSGYDREHVTPYIRSDTSLRHGQFKHTSDLSGLRWTVDEAEDIEVVSAVFENFSPEFDFSWLDVLDLSRTRPELFSRNSRLERNEGASMGTGQKLWRRAKNIIPGGNMLLSKRAEMFLPELWPAYFSRAKGCRVWDLDGNEFIDMSIMGIGTNSLGYGHSEVDAAVKKVVEMGNMSTLNCPEEVYLAERLIELHDWAEMARFARSGGEANAIAIRIARAAAGRDIVAVCGYHGWHDWYLSANLGDDENLAGHLLPGLEPRGVPKNLRGTVFPFAYNNFSELLRIVNEHDVGVIKMEVVRNEEPKDDFLQKVRDLATERGIVLIFDECTSGFRQTFGGLHKDFRVEPDMAMFGKTLGNGYAITAVIGRREVMEAAQSTFISSTFWTERIGPAAALKTLEVMEEIKSWEVITQLGTVIRKGWQDLADKHGLDVDHWGLPALAGFTFRSNNSLAYKTLISQEMLEKGYLAGNCVYACIEHTPEIIEGFFDSLDPVFGLIRECEDGRDISSLLKGPVCHGGFKRLN